ncbi:MAG: anaerobic ribonucleoside-triphosphate reductase activating protein [Bacilli bacterium]|nr:anaerobic ribonucleoside-triphosphate reductase activating protein [Bacilli bacterium]
MDFVGLEKLSLVDYDQHLSAVLFMAGCPFRCPFCHNSDLVIHPENAKAIPWEEIYAFLKKRVGVLDGVVITGGEPTLMPDLLEKMKAIKDLGYQIKLDTNGSHPNIVKEAVSLGLVDYIAMDIKNSKEKYPLTAGVPNLDIKPIEESVEFIMNSGIDYEFRTTIIDEHHDLASIKDIANWIKGAKKYFLQRYIDNEHCIDHGLHMVEKEKALTFVKTLESQIDYVSLRGYE